MSFWFTDAENIPNVATVPKLARIKLLSPLAHTQCTTLKTAKGTQQRKEGGREGGSYLAGSTQRTARLMHA